MGISPTAIRPVVLIVQPDPAARVGYARDFERAGCTAIPAEDVPEAITCLLRPWLAIDAVLLSLALPGARAETLLTIVKNTPRFAHIRTVAHSAGDDPARVLALAGYGAAAYVEGVGFPLMWAALFPPA